jgi:predicted ABC-type ATPase
MARETTLYERFLARSASTFVNPDRIAEELNPSDPASIAWDAARLADDRRTALLQAGEDFVTETVFSHESKLDFIGEAKAAGFHTRGSVHLPRRSEFERRSRATPRGARRTRCPG